MGIKGYTRWVDSTWPDAFLAEGEVKGCDHIYVDLNAILHTAVRRAGKRSKNWSPQKIEDACIMFVFQGLDQIVKRCPPRKSVTLALDGAAPFAKIATQRRRRQAEAIGISDQDLGRLGMSPLAISRGTPLMRKIGESLEYYAASRRYESPLSHSSETRAWWDRAVEPVRCHHTKPQQRRTFDTESLFVWQVEWVAREIRDFCLW